jgi:hypothetical protein
VTDDSTAVDVIFGAEDLAVSSNAVYCSGHGSDMPTNQPIAFPERRVETATLRSTGYRGY